VNLETDVLAKYVEKLLRVGGPAPLNVERLKEQGY
jgi:riboflavin synthase alpha subunit